MHDVAPIVRPLPPAAQPIGPAKFVHFVLCIGQIDRLAARIPPIPAGKTPWYMIGSRN